MFLFFLTILNFYFKGKKKTKTISTNMKVKEVSIALLLGRDKTFSPNIERIKTTFSNYSFFFNL